MHARVCRLEETALTLAAWRVHAHARREFIQAANSIGQNVQRVSSQPHLRRAARMPSAIFRSLHQRYQFEFHLATIKTQPITRASDGRKTHLPAIINRALAVRSSLHPSSRVRASTPRRAAVSE